MDKNETIFNFYWSILFCPFSGIVSRLNKFTDDDDSAATDRLDSLSRFQAAILEHALRFPNVKKVVYSTCSIHVQENEEVVENVFQKVQEEFDFSNIMPDWSERGEAGYEHAQYFMRMAPESSLTNGFFVACFVRKNDIGDKTMAMNGSCDQELQEAETEIRGNNCKKKSKKHKKSELEDPDEEENIQTHKHKKKKKHKVQDEDSNDETSKHKENRNEDFDNSKCQDKKKKKKHKHKDKHENDEIVDLDCIQNGHKKHKKKNKMKENNDNLEEYESGVSSETRGHRESGDLSLDCKKHKKSKQKKHKHCEADSDDENGNMSEHLTEKTSNKKKHKRKHKEGSETEEIDELCSPKKKKEKK